MNFDIIGDVHGRYDQLVTLLSKLGYHNSNGAWRKTNHMAVFVGDLIDVGEKQVETVNLVRRMVLSNTAYCLMGNHEFNAIAWATPDLESPGEFLRSHEKPNNRKQHEAFLNEVEGKSIHGEMICWFKTLPLWLDLGGVRVVHACWHDDSMNILRSAPYNYDAKNFNHDLLIRSSQKGDRAYEAVEMLCKGMEVKLPQGYSFIDRGMHERSDIRIKWWESHQSSYRKAALVSDDIIDTIPDLPMKIRTTLKAYEGVPVFFGHYGLCGTPRLFDTNVACLDFSHGQNGILTAYQWAGEEKLEEKRLIYTK